MEAFSLPIVRFCQDPLCQEANATVMWSMLACAYVNFNFDLFLHKVCKYMICLCNKGKLHGVAICFQQCLTIHTSCIWTIVYTYTHDVHVQALITQLEKQLQPSTLFRVYSLSYLFLSLTQVWCYLLAVQSVFEICSLTFKFQIK